jgi:uncharacterized membrane protein
MIVDIFIITFLVGLLDSLYLYNNHKLYNNINIKYNYLYFLPSIWLIMAISIYFLVYKNNNSVNDIIIKSFILALSIFYTYNLTNYLIFNNWTMKMAIIDTLWGISLIVGSSILFHYIKNNKYISM